MVDGQETIAEIQAPDVEAPEAQPPETEEPDAPSEPDDEPVDLQAALKGDEPEDEPSSEGGDEPPADDPDEIVELDWHGTKIRGPKSFQAEIDNLNADYTRKSQANATKARELEQRATDFAEREKSYQEDMDYQALKMARLGEIQQYANANWEAWYQEDPSAAGAAQARWQALRQEVDAIDQHLSQRRNERTEQAKQDTAKRLSETETWARENIKGWSPEVQRETVSFAVETLGFSPQQLQAAMNPEILQTLHYAKVGHQVLNKPAAPAKKPPPKPQPTSTVKPRGNAQVRKSLGEMSMDEYVAARKAGRKG